MSEIRYVETYWSGVVQRLQSEVQFMNRLVPHRGEQGRANELTLHTLLASLLPQSVAVGSGIVIDSAGSASGQCDAILYDASRQPRFMAQTTQMLFPLETVLAVIEVKTTLDDAELEKVAASQRKLRSLQTLADAPPPPFYLLAYGAGLLPQSLMDKFKAIPVEERPEFSCILATATIGERLDDGSFRAGVAALHRSDESGNRMSNHWEEPPPYVMGDPRSGIFVRAGMTYPVTRLAGKAGSARVVCEPGRALLLFAQRILKDLERRGAIEKSYFANYLTPLAHEQLSLDPQ